MNYEIVVATQNQNKMKEYRELIKGLPITLYSISDLNLDLDIIENGKTYHENALIKAKALQKFTNLPILADDSGIEINCLGSNFPGIHTHHFADENGGFPKVLLKILSLMTNENNRSSSYYCSIVFLNKSAEPLYFDGKCNGKIDNAIKGNNGFGFDPIFFSDELQKNLGLATEEEKNLVSHRYKAFIKFLAYLKVYSII